MKKKIAIIHPHLVSGGGSEVCALWAAESLKKDHDVSLVSMGDINLDELNKCYGTDLKNSEVSIITIPLPIFFKGKFSAARSRLPRFCKKIAPKFDLMISTYNVMDFGKRGIQFIADFSFDDKLRRVFNAELETSKKWIYRDSLLRNCYLKFGRILSGTSEENWKKNLTVSNSEWESRILKKTYGIESAVIYPPVTGGFPNIDWEKKENGFLLIGRISPEKEIEKVIEILIKARKNNPDIHLHIVGRIDDIGYAKNIKKICEENNSWCFLEDPVYGKKKLDFIAGHKFGISGRANEPFGIAVAEMVKAGCIVFVPDGGGQTEIVSNADLVYKNKDDAAEKINRVLKNSVIQSDLRDYLFKQSQKFSTEKFKQEVKNMVCDFFR